MPVIESIYKSAIIKPVTSDFKSIMIEQSVKIVYTLGLLDIEVDNLIVCVLDHFESCMKT